MLRLVDGNWEVVKSGEYSLFQGNSMFYDCGRAVYNYMVSLWANSQLKHSQQFGTRNSHGKALAFAQVYTQMGTKLCTIFTQFYNTFVSVNSSLVHTIHIAYKDQSKVKKGII